MRLSLRGASIALFFLTAAISAPVRADFSFVHVTDAHVGAVNGPGSNAAIDSQLFTEISGLNPKPAFVVNTGDVCETATDAEYATHATVQKSLSLPYYVAPGNHDVRWNPRGKEGFTRGTGQPLYQSWDKDNVHFVVLDSTVLLQHWGHFDKAELDWLAADLKKTGTRKPVIIGFHHWIFREGGLQVDNQSQLMDVLAPYNVRLFLIGHGHSDIQWSVNGIPAIMAKGLYQGSYHLIKVTRDKLTVYRRTAKSGAPSLELFSESLLRPAVPARTAKVTIVNGKGVATFARGDWPEKSTVSLRFDEGKEQPMTATADGWQGSFALDRAIPGTHRVTVILKTPEDRAYQTVVLVPITGPGAIAPLWQINVGGAVQGKIVQSAGTVYVPSMGGDLVALDAKTGKERWRYKTGGSIFSAPLVSEDTVYFGSADHFIYAVDARNGKMKWKHETQGAVFGGAARAADVVCIASTDRTIYGLDAATGKVRWTVAGGNMFQSQAATDGERFFVGGWDNQFRAIESATGKEIWKQPFGRNAKTGTIQFYYAPAIGSPTVADGKVLVTSNDGLLHAMDATTGAILWEVNRLPYGGNTEPRSPSLGYSGPLLRGDRIYNASLTDLGYVFCFDRDTGNLLWNTPTGSVIYDSSCADSSGNVFVGCVDGTFSALRARDGALQWQYRLPPGHLLASPATDEERVFIGSLNGEVFAFPAVVPVSTASTRGE